jgi:hypothetical protein
VVGIINGEDIVEVDYGRTLTNYQGFVRRAEITYRRPLATVDAPAFVSSNQTHRGI